MGIRTFLPPSQKSELIEMGYYSLGKLREYEKKTLIWVESLPRVNVEEIKALYRPITLFIITFIMTM
jgi:hypothetical protein